MKRKLSFAQKGGCFFLTDKKTRTFFSPNSTSITIGMHCPGEDLTYYK